MEDTLRDYEHQESKRFFVLILVLMEDTLRVCVGIAMIVTAIVLILVLMEDTLRVPTFTKMRRRDLVLILVLMEDTLRVPFY